MVNISLHLIIIVVIIFFIIQIHSYYFWLLLLLLHTLSYYISQGKSYLHLLIPIIYILFEIYSILDTAFLFYSLPFFSMIFSNCLHLSGFPWLLLKSLKYYWVVKPFLWFPPTSASPRVSTVRQLWVWYVLSIIGFFLNFIVQKHVECSQL